MSQNKNNLQIASTYSIHHHLHYASTIFGFFDMSKRKHPTKSSGKCPIAFALETVGDKWSLIILRDILFKGKRHYGEFLSSAEKISTNILANRLDKLESEGLINKTQDTENLSRFVYSLTDKGKDLLPLLLEMVKWSVKYDPQPGIPDNIITGAPGKLLERLQENRDALITEILSRLEERNE